MGERRVRWFRPRAPGFPRRVLLVAHLLAVPLRRRPELAGLGVGVPELGDESAPRLGVALAAEAGPKQTLRCERRRDRR